MEDLLRYLLNGLSYGMLLFLIASGLSLVLGVMGILNLAHGSLYMFGAYLGLTLSQQAGAPWAVALIGGALGAALLGLAMERLLLRRLHRRYNEQVLMTLGLVYVFGNAALWIWGSYPLLGRPPAFLSASIALGQLSFPVYRIALLVVGLLVAAGLWWFQEKTRAGAIVRAGMDDKEMTTALGINYGLVCSGVFLLGAGLAGMAGVLGAPLLGAKWDMAFPVLLSAMIVVVVGGIGRVEGTLLGALLIGLLDTVGKTFFPDFAMFTIYLVFILVLLIKPTGLLGRLQMDSGGAPPGTATARRVAADGFIQKLVRWLPLLVIAALLLAAPQFGSAYFRSMLTEILIFALFALSLNLLFGYTGLFSLGHAAFFGLGAYAAGLLTLRFGVDSYWLVMPAAVIVAAIAAMLAGLVALRTTGVYFLFVTLAIGELLVAISLKWTDLTGGSNGLFGIAYPDLGFGRMKAAGFYYFVLAIFALCAWLLYRIVHSPFGLALQGIRDDERRMRHLGYNTQLFKLAAFTIGGIFAGVAGALYAPFSGTVVPGYLGAVTSTLVMLMAIIGGSGYFFGPALGAALIIALQYYASLYLPERWHMILGAMFVVTVLVLPGGILALPERLKRRFARGGA